MVVVKNIKSSNEILTFEIDNKSSEYKLSLCNGIRRIILSEIELFCLDWSNEIYESEGFPDELVDNEPEEKGYEI